MTEGLLTEQPQDEQADEGLMEAMDEECLTEEGLIAMTKKVRLALEKRSVLYARQLEEIKACFWKFSISSLWSESAKHNELWWEVPKLERLEELPKMERQEVLPKLER